MKSSAIQNSQPVPTAAKPFFNKGAEQSFFSGSTEQAGSFFTAGSIQASLTVGSPDDPFEKEAEQVSRQVVDGFDQAGTIQRKLTGFGLQQLSVQPSAIDGRISRKLQKTMMRAPIVIQAKCEHCGEEDKLQQKSGSIQFAGQGSEVSAGIETQIQSMRGGGQAMDNKTKTAMESSFGADFSGVRVHTNTQAVQMSQQLNAHAFTVGNDIFFNQGKYEPAAKDGAALLAHELTHTVQQGASVQRRRVNRQSLLSSLPEHAMAHLSTMNGTQNGLNRKEILQLQEIPAEEIKMQQLQMLQMKGADEVQQKAGTGIMRSCGSTPAPNACAPVSMSKVISGPFENGLTMDSYYPDLATRGIYNNPGTAGPYNTGTMVGSKVQLIATVPPACASGSFTFGQTVTYTHFTVNGAVQPLVGVVQDDISKSGRNFSTAPARQEWTSGTQKKISMADPPSISYTATDNIEWDRSFVTSLSNGGNSQQVSWSTSIRVAGGVVTRNTVS